MRITMIIQLPVGAFAYSVFSSQAYYFLSH